jgi:hypothetical protein
MILEKCDFTRMYVDSLEIEGPERRKKWLWVSPEQVTPCIPGYSDSCRRNAPTFRTKKFPKEPKRAYYSYTSRSIGDRRIAKTREND